MKESTKKELRNINYRIEELNKIVSDIKESITRRVNDEQGYLLYGAIADIQRYKDYINELEYTKKMKNLLLRVAGEEQEEAKAGRPTIEMPKNFKLYYDKWKNGEIQANTCMEFLGLKRTTFYKLVKEYEMQEQEK